MQAKEEEAYDRMLPILTLAKCRKLKRKKIDLRIYEIENSNVFRHLKSYYEEQSVEYWETLELMGDCNDLAVLEHRKKALRDLWRSYYAGQDQHDGDSKDPENNSNRSSR